ncbi:UNVERIFIED_CONTAM: G patch domain-containing protein 11 [Siphonaria sp. JEL0065]|nr:G patch domain-containing protein 11 [Siphonaria sp. JEL0065]
MSKRPTQQDDDDDYLTMTFEEEPKPKRQLTYAEKRRRDQEESLRKGTVKSTKEREIEAREAGLKATVLKEDNKGFSMLAKLGFKKGMTLGRDDALSVKLHEPIAVNMKTGTNSIHKFSLDVSISLLIGHGGLGMDSLHREMRQSQEKEANSAIQQTQQEYRASAAKKREEARMYGELMRARKAVQSLDEAGGLERTELWVPERKQKLLVDDYTPASIKSDVLAARETFYNEIATDAETEGDADADGDQESAFEQLETVDKLYQVNAYLRSKYYYCVWCSDKYANLDEMESHCPGSTRDDHDVDD